MDPRSLPDQPTAADVLQLVADVLSVDNCQRYAAERSEPGEYAIAVTHLVGSVTGIIDALDPSLYATAAGRLRGLLVGGHGECPECSTARTGQDHDTRHASGEGTAR